MSKVFVLQHRYNYGENNKYTETKDLGVYSSKEKANENMMKYSELPGFKDYPQDCFVISEYVIDKDTGWTDGFRIK